MLTVLLVAIALGAGPVGQAADPTPTPPRPTPELASFFQALDAAKQPGSDRKVRILWWGDSAIVSDGYTGHVRAALQKRFGDGGPGFVHVAPTFEGYLHDQVRVFTKNWKGHSVLLGNLKSGRYGLGGVESHSFGGGNTVYVSQDDTPFEQIHILYRARPKGGVIQVFDKKGSTPWKEVSTAADKAADAVWTQDLPPGTDRVRVRAGGQGLVRLYGVALENKGGGVVLDTLGVVGMRARRLFNADAKHLAGQIRFRSPDLLVLNFGGNERVDPGLTADKHAEEIAQAVRMIRAGAPKAACLVVGPLAHGARKGGRIVLDPDLRKVYAGQKKAAADTGCGFLDTVELMGGDDAVASFRRKHLIAGDLAHLNGKGHRAVGELMAGWLNAQYDAWKAAQATQAASKPEAQPPERSSSGGASPVSAPAASSGD